MTELHPLSIILVESGSKGDRLLFRFPHLMEETSPATSNHKMGRYTAAVSEDVFSPCPEIFSNIRHHRIVGFSDKLLSNLCTVQPASAGRRFEVKVSDVRFVGHPTIVKHTSRRSSASSSSDDAHKSAVHLFNIVFALWAKADHSVVDCYHRLSQRLAIAVNHEQSRCQYLTRQSRDMLAIHEEIASLAESSQLTSPYNAMISKCQLASELHSVYEGLVQTGTVYIAIGGWINVSFALPHKIHKLYSTDSVVEPRHIHKCLSLLRPYHTLLLLQPGQQLFRQLPADSAPALRRLVRTCSVVHNLTQLAADADITLRHVFQLVGHLVYWAKAAIIYPLCEKNVYAISPNASIIRHSRLSNDFSERFSGQSLHSVLSEFSQPCSVSSIIYPSSTSNSQSVRVEMLVWLLQRKLLVQLHLFVFFTPDKRLPDPLSEPSASASASDHTASSDSPFARLSQRDRLSVLSVSAAKDAQSLALFCRLFPYFNGRHHVEEMMHAENLTRLQVHRLLEQFAGVLTTCSKTDHISNCFS